VENGGAVTVPEMKTDAEGTSLAAAPQAPCDQHRLATVRLRHVRLSERSPSSPHSIVGPLVSAGLQWDD
jgi:hypothetical protein